MDFVMDGVSPLIPFFWRRASLFARHFETIQLDSLFGQHSLELANLFAERDFTRVLPHRFISRGELIAPPA
jgi:hypothetical protein